VRGDLLERLSAVAGLDDAAAARLEEVGDCGEDGRVVVDDEA
jgi:hypothetical protein